MERSIAWGDFEEKFSSFGWETCSIDGHNHKELREKLSSKNHEKPFVIIASTIKGKGCPSIENNPAWHHRAPNDEELEMLIKELEA